MVLCVRDKHTAATSLWLLYFTKRFHFLSQFLCFSVRPVRCLHLTPARGPNPAVRGGEAALPAPASRPPWRFWLPKGGQQCRDGCPWVSEPGLRGTMWTYGKAAPTQRPVCLQWHGSVQATASLSSLPTAEMALSESSPIFLGVEKNRSRQAVGLA